MAVPVTGFYHNNKANLSMLQNPDEIKHFLLKSTSITLGRVFLRRKNTALTVGLGFIPAPPLITSGAPRLNLGAPSVKLGGKTV